MILSNLHSTENIEPWIPPTISRTKSSHAIQNVSEGESAQNSKYSPDDPPPLVSVDELKEKIEIAKREGYEDGYAEGHNCGLSQSETANKEEKNQLLHLIKDLRQPLNRIDNRITTELATLAVSIAKSIVQKEIEHDADYYRNLIHKVFNEYTDLSETTTIRLHPQDVALVMDAASPDESLQDSLVSDTSLARGSCMIESVESYIDVGLDSIINRITENIRQQIDTPVKD